MEPAITMGLSPGQRPVYGGAGFAPEGAGVATDDGAAVGEAPPLESATVTAQPSSVPGPAMVDPVTLLITKLWDAAIPGWRLNLAWSGSAGPFSLVTSPYPRFQTSVTTLADSTIETSQSFAANTGRTLECFEVSDGTTVTVAGQNLGYDPRPNPTAATYTVKGYWWGENITVSASYLDAIGPENLAHFYDRPATGFLPVADASRPGYASQVTFTIPADTHSTYLRLEAAGKMSPYTGWLQMVAPGVTFGSVTGIVWAPQDGKAYVTDGVSNNISMVDLFKVVPTASSLALGMAVTNPRISRVSDAGEFVYISGAAGAPQVRVWTAGGGDAPYANTTDSGFTSSITPLGIALHPNGSVCYIADGLSMRVIRIPRNNSAAINGNWGGRTFAFPTPCGIDVEPSGALDVGSGYATYRITGAASYTSNGGTGSILPKHLEVDRDMNYTSGTGFIAYASEPFGDAYNRNPIETVGSEEGSGGVPRYTGAIVWSTDDTQHLLLDQIYRYNLYPHYPQAVILNNSGKSTSEAAYPSTNQTQDRIIKITASGLPTRALQLRLIDPPDFAPYAPVGGWCGTTGFPPTGGSCTAVPPYEGNDNIVGDTYGLTTDPNGVSPAPAMEMRLDFASGQWTKDFYLKVPARYSGNNFRVEARKINPNTNLPVAEKIVALSGLYTTWKRVFVERDRMFRRGGLLRTSAAINDTFVLLYKNPNDTRMDNLVDGDKVALFDASTPFEGPHDEAYIPTGGIDANYAPAGAGEPHRVKVSLVTARSGATPYPLGKSYTASPANPTTYWPNFGDATGKSAGAGVVNSNDGLIYDTASNQINGTGSAFYDADMRGVEAAFSDASAEVLGRAAGAGAVPYMSPASPFYTVGTPSGPEEMMRINFIGRWSTNATTSNYLYLLGCVGKPLVPGTLTAGLTNKGQHYSFIYVKTVTDWGENNVPPFTAEQTLWSLQANQTHETGHNFLLNNCSNLSCGSESDLKDHDNRSWWFYSGSGCPSANPCLEWYSLLNPPIDTRRFCKEDLLLGDPNCNPSQKPNTSIRTIADPLP